MSLINYKNRILLISFLVTIVGCSFDLNHFGQFKHISKAESLLRQDKFEEACGEYKLHIADRLAVEDRPKWENPYFYYLIIGDIKLRASNVNEALAAYEFAEKMHVDLQLVSDRYRYVAQWYENKGQHGNAIKILAKYRDRDPLLFDAVLDRVARELTILEDSTKKSKTFSTDKTNAPQHVPSHQDPAEQE